MNDDELENTKVEKLLDWKVFDESVYQDSAQWLSHFSGKMCNSNTLATGIRIGHQRRSLPYISVSTLTETDVPFDLLYGATDSPVVRQVNAVLQNSTDRNIYKSIPETERKKVLKIKGSLSESSEAGAVNHLSMRYRQIILQNADGSDIAATPLASAGLAALIHERIQNEWEQLNPLSDDDSGSRDYSQGFRKRLTASLHVGGQNAQNVTVHQQAVRSPLVFLPPARAAAVNPMTFAVSLHFRGIQKLIDPRRFLNLVVWQKRHVELHLSTSRMSMAIRAELERLLLDLTAEVLRRAQEAHSLLTAVRAKLPDQSLSSADLGFLQKALIDPSIRSREWSQRFAVHYLSELEGFTVKVKGKHVALDRQHIDKGTWLAILEGAFS